METILIKRKVDAKKVNIAFQVDGGKGYRVKTKVK